MKYKLIKKLNGIPKGLVFECEVSDTPSLTTVKVYGSKYSNLLETYITLVGIDDKDSFEKIEEDVLVPDCIEINKVEDTSLVIIKGKQGLTYDGENYVVFNITSGVLNIKKVKCKLIKTTFAELKPGDAFVDCDVNNNIELKKLYNYNIYCGEQGNYNAVYLEDGVEEIKYDDDDKIYKVVQV